MGVGGCPAVVAQWQSTGSSSQVSWVRLPATADFFTFIYFRLITSISSVRQDALSISCVIPTSIQSIPLYSAFVVEVYLNSKKDETLIPKTMTELHSSLVCSLLLCHLFDHPVHGKRRRWRVRRFSDFPQDVYQQLCELGRIAYEGILHDQQVNLPEDFETLGLIAVCPRAVCR